MNFLTGNHTVLMPSNVNYINHTITTPIVKMKGTEWSRTSITFMSAYLLTFTNNTMVVIKNLLLVDWGIFMMASTSKAAGTLIISSAVLLNPYIDADFFQTSVSMENSVTISGSLDFSADVLSLNNCTFYNMISIMIWLKSKMTASVIEIAHSLMPHLAYHRAV